MENGGLAVPRGCCTLGLPTRLAVRMEFRILGPLEVLDEGRRLALGGRKPRALLALLLLHRAETLGTERLIDELWGERPPATAAKSLRVHVSRLRAALSAGSGGRSDELVVTRGHGYQLMLDPEHLDPLASSVSSRGTRELVVGRPERAVVALEEGLSLWRGRPLDDLAYEPFAQQEIARLDDLRVAALEELVEAKLALGRHAEVLAALEPLIAEHPYRERLRAQLMLALYRCDRQADALQGYQDARRALVEELGIEPGERLRELERAILAQDPALAAPAAPPDIGRSRRSARPRRHPRSWSCPRGGDIPADRHRGLVGSVGGRCGRDGGGARAPRRADRRRCGGHAGRLLKAKGEGDSTLTVFRRASDAAACAVEIQRRSRTPSGPAGSTCVHGWLSTPARRMSVGATTSARRSTEPPG